MKNGHSAFFSRPQCWGLRSNVHCSSQTHWKGRSRLPIRSL